MHSTSFNAVIISWIVIQAFFLKKKMNFNYASLYIIIISEQKINYYFDNQIIMREQSSGFQSKSFYELQPISAKKIIIVVGSPGVGKSSFCLSLSPERHHQNILDTDQTLQIVVHEVDPNIHLLKEQNQGLYIMDTPGIQNLNSVYLVLEQIDRLIMTEKYNIVGIAYVIDIDKRQIGEDDQGNDIWLYEEFFRCLKLKTIAKKALHFIVFSKWDRFYEEQNINEARFEEWKEILSQKNMSQLWDRHTHWTVQPSEDKDIYRQFLDSEKGKMLNGSKIQKLRQIIRQNQKKAIPFEQYACRYEIFIHHFIQEIQNKIKDNQNLTLQWAQTEQITIQMKIKREVSSKDQKLGIASTVIGAVGTVSGIVRIVLSIVAIATASTLTAGTILIPIGATIGIGLAVSAIKFGIKKLKTNKALIQKDKTTISFNNGQKQVLIAKKLEQKLYQKRKQIYLAKIFDGLKIDKDFLSFNNKWFSKVEIEIDKQKMLFKDKIELPKKMELTIKLICQIPLPELDQLVKMLAKSAKQIFDQ